VRQSRHCQKKKFWKKLGKKGPKEINSIYKEKYEAVLNWICVKFNSKERF
jgi:hypothetical protein